MRIPLLLVLLGAIAPTEAKAEMQPTAPDRAAFERSCIEENAVDSTSPSADERALCQDIWRNAQSGLPLADAILTLASYLEEPTLARACAAFPRMAWRRAQGEILNVMPDALLTGRLGTREVVLYGEEGMVRRLSIQVAVRGPRSERRGSADWIDALAVRGASVIERNCAQFPGDIFGTEEPVDMVAISIEVPEGAPLHVLEQVSGQGSTTSIGHVVELRGAVPTLSDLQSNNAGVLGAEGMGELWAACEG